MERRRFVERQQKVVSEIEHDPFSVGSASWRPVEASVNAGALTTW
jgi:hypothetical protein